MSFMADTLLRTSPIDARAVVQERVGVQAGEPRHAELVQVAVVVQAKDPFLGEFVEPFLVSRLDVKVAKKLAVQVVEPLHAC
ncbi:hypothetical protein EDC27_0030 [Desulfosoma caldarium]|uniref:Uncharacterized protein n=1 Tax=Desulfosoma caldarium TaxID=610254 RepID=A0A3N1VR04_9BACT|nr:hypothetical protein EDC27_0030 [Desulfosoma caldarium]